MIFARGLIEPETPRQRADGTWMCVENGGGTIAHISSDGLDIRRILHVGRPNGLCIDGAGAAWVAVTDPLPLLLRVTLDGGQETILTGCGDTPFLFPNDLCLSSAGLIYMTDSGMRLSDWAPRGVRPDWRTAEFAGCVYEIDPVSHAIRPIDQQLKFANGIAVGPDGFLYANEMVTGNVYRYRLVDGRVAGGREYFGNVNDPAWSGGFHGPDGMAFSSDGRLWCCVYGEGRVTILDRNGQQAGHIRTAGAAPTNIAFGANGARHIYVSEHSLGQIERHDVDGQGLPLHSPVHGSLT